MYLVYIKSCKINAHCANVTMIEMNLEPDTSFIYPKRLFRFVGNQFFSWDILLPEISPKNYENNNKIIVITTTIRKSFPWKLGLKAHFNIKRDDL